MLLLLQMLLGVAILAAAIVPFLPAARAEANVGVPIYTPTLTALPPTLGVLQEAIQREARHFSTVDVCGDAVCDQMVRQANGLARLKTIRKYIVEAVRYLGRRSCPCVLFILFLFTCSAGLGVVASDAINSPHVYAYTYQFVGTYDISNNICAHVNVSHMTILLLFNVSLCSILFVSSII